MTDWRFKLFIDGGCPLCRREAGLLRRMDRGRGRLVFADIASADFDAAALGVSHERLMQEMHGQTPDGRLVTGMEAFRGAYRAVGWGWLLAPTGWPLLRPIFDAAYRLFARNRHRLTRRSCETDACSSPTGAKPREGGASRRAGRLNL